MNLNDVYDSDNQLNVDGWKRLPTVLRYFVTSQQKSLVDRVKREVVKKYGQNGLQDLVKTSGWRSVSANSGCGGVADSLHLFGCAVDFRKQGIFSNNSIPVCCDLQCIDSGKCWHVQFKRS